MTDWTESLSHVAEIWLDRRDPFRIETVDALTVSTGLHPQQIELALVNCFEELTRAKLEAYAASLAL